MGGGSGWLSCLCFVAIEKIDLIRFLEEIHSLSFHSLGISDKQMFTLVFKGLFTGASVSFIEVLFQYNLPASFYLKCSHYSIPLSARASFCSHKT